MLVFPRTTKHATRRARGLEAAVVDNDSMTVTALAQGDGRTYDVRVAGTAALLVSKAHKIGERAEDASHRLVDKDAYDVYRSIATETALLAADLTRLRADELSGDSTVEAIEFISVLFAAGPDATGSAMAGRAEEGIGEPATVALQTSILASDLLTALGN